MKSIQSQLTVWLAAAMVAVSFASGGGLVAWLRHAMVDEFDASLLLRAHALQSLVTRRDDGRLDVDVNLAALSEFTGRRATDYFALDDANGARIIGSAMPMLDGADRAGHAAWDTRLPSGVAARGMRVSFRPVREDEEDDRAAKPSADPAELMPLFLTIARDRRPLDALLLRITVAVGLSTASLSCVAVAAAVGVVRRGLAPLRRVAGDVGSVDFSKVGARIDTAAVPRELLPIVARVNELLARVAETLARERLFTAAVSHELRTPIAELRLASDIALRYPDDPTLRERAVAQSQEIAVQMGSMVATLLSITGHRHGTAGVALEAVPLRDLVCRAVHRCESTLTSRAVTVDADGVSGELVVRADRIMLAAVVDNLVSNASRYARPQTRLEVRATLHESVATVLFVNEHDGLSDGDVARLFDPFWRKDAARSEGDHVGLGLTLVKAYCDAMDVPVDARLRVDGRLAVTLELREASRTDGDS